MEWVKLVATPPFYLDGALLRAGEAAEVLFCRAIAHCGHVESSGRIDKTLVPMLVPSKAQQRANALVREGLWLDLGDHYLIRTWGKWQDEHDAAAAKRSRDRDRMRQIRAQERDMSRDSRATVAAQSPNKSQSESDSRALDVEVEVEKCKTTRSTALSLVAADRFDEWWAAYPRRVGKKAAKTAYVRALRSVSHDVLLSAACRYRDDSTRDPGYTAHPATWLNAGRWDDEGPTRPAAQDSRGRRIAPADVHPHMAHLWETS